MSVGLEPKIFKMASSEWFDPLASAPHMLEGLLLFQALCPGEKQTACARTLRFGALRTFPRGKPRQWHIWLSEKISLSLWRTALHLEYAVQLLERRELGCETRLLETQLWLRFHFRLKEQWQKQNHLSLLEQLLWFLLSYSRKVKTSNAELTCANGGAEQGRMLSGVALNELLCKA